jgi:hypothetical protein
MSFPLRQFGGEMHRFLLRLLPILVLLSLWWVPARAAIGPTLVCGDDMLLHLLRVVQIDHLWSQGILYARWAPDMGWGYGYPVFNFYPPLSYFVAGLIARLGFGITPGVRIALALTFLMAGLGMYVLARDFFREEAAVIAAVAAMYAPYVAYNPLYRGALPEAMGWALLPWAGWAVGRAVRTGRRGWMVAGALIFGALLVTHSVAAVIGTGLVALYAGVEALASSSVPLRRRLLAAAVTVGLGLGLSLFFWIPAWAERPLVQLERVPYGFPGGYRSHFFWWSYTVTALEPVRPDLVNPYPPRSLGLVSVLLGVPGLLGLFRFRDVRQRQVAFFAATGLLTTLMALPVSLPVWRAFPFLHNFQFPWRFLGPAALALAFLTGAMAELLTGLRWRYPLMGLMVLALVAADLGWLWNARYCPGWDQVSIGSLHNYEYMGGGVGTSGGEFLPRLVPGRPPYSAADPFEPTALPEGATLEGVRTGPFFAEAWVDTPQAFRVVVNRFFYPGWRAWVDGNPVEIAPETEWGRFTFPVPPGRHHLVVRFGETPLRLAADLLSVLSLLALALIAILPARVAQDLSCPSQDKSRATAGVAQDSSCISQDKSRATAGVAQDLSCISQDKSRATAGVAQDLSCISQDKSRVTAGVAQDLSCISQDKSRATAGVAQDSSCLPQDKSRATAGVAQDSSCISQDKSRATAGVAQDLSCISQDKSRATAGVAQDSSCLPQDKSRATAGVAQDSSCLPQDKSRATADVAQDSSCPAARDVSRRETAWLLLLPLLVTAMVLLAERLQPPPLYERRLTETGLRNVPIPAHIVYDGQFHLLGWQPIPATVPADQPIPVWLYWRDLLPGGPDYRIWLSLKDAEEETWNSPAISPSSFRSAPSPRVWPPDRYAITAWNVHPLVGTPPGVYTVTLVVFDGETLLPYTAYQDGQALGPEISLAQVQLTRPSAAPSLETLGIPVTATMPVWGPIRLLKGTVREQESRPGDPLHLEFYWESLADPDEDYRMRLWFSGEGGREWERPLSRADFPTSQWRAGDRWVGLHTLRLPPGLGSGDHELWLQLCRRDGETCHPVGEPYRLGSLRVQAPPRSWTVPPLGLRTDARLGDEVTLLGADWEPHGETLQPGSTLTVTLVWRGEREMETSYRVFLHMLGPDGLLVAQSDGEPAGWARPTTGWLPGEVVVDERVLVLPPDLPPGEYRLMAGMYRYGGPRLTTPDGTDAILLAHFRVR